MRRLSVLLVVLGCPADDGEPVDAEGTSTSTAASTFTSTSTSTFTSGSTSTPTPSSTTTSMGTSSSSGSSSTTAAPEQACGLEDLKPGEPDPIEAGTEAGQIPPDIGQILLTACGCHLADDLAVAVPDYLGAFDMTTWDGWQADHPVAKTPYHEVANGYLADGAMPLASACNVDGEAMDPDDRAVLIDWTGQASPDGATWLP